MKLSVSNIAWNIDDDKEMYKYLREKGIFSIEIAPTRIFPNKPYEDLKRAKEWTQELKIIDNLFVSSVQSIWYGKEGNIFHSKDRMKLIEYTYSAIDFAKEIGAYNLVFGNPRARCIPIGIGEKESNDIAISFFREIGNYAKKQGVVIGLEANPVIYNTNFINNTKSAIEMVKKISSDGCRLNLDLGTIIYNFNLDNEKSDLVGAERIIEEALFFSSHIHISEPNLKPIQKRILYELLFKHIKLLEYKGYVSIEMARREDLNDIKTAISYVRTLAERYE